MNRRDFIKTSGWTLMGLAASGTLLGLTRCTSSTKNPKPLMPPLKDINYYLGDIHNHCNLTYGHGDLEDAIAAARGQLDFVSITPHAMWPDIPGRNDERLSWVIDYHTGAFDRLRSGGWDKYVKMMNQADEPGKFISMLSYECHSMEHGDHVVLNYDKDAPLVECTSVPDLKLKLKDKRVFVTPHHMGYIEGYRGYNWDAFPADEQIPFVEMFSRHGLAESDQGDYNYLHDMGPRTYEGTVQYGLEQGHKFGLIGSTDQHAGYPGSYGDGRMVVLAPELTRDALWDAMAARRVYCVTGDKIKLDFRINDALMGAVIKGNNRNIYVGVEACNFIDYVDVIKNGSCLGRISGPYTAPATDDQVVRAKIKIELGWNREEEYVHWLGDLQLSEGTLNEAVPCFRGAAFTSPQPGDDHFTTRVSRLTEHRTDGVSLDIYSSKNPNVLTPAMQAVMLDVTMPRTASITAKLNGETISYTLDELLKGSKAHFMRGWLSEAVLFNRAAPQSVFMVEQAMNDDAPERDTDYYYLRVRQRDGQWAWSTPIWVERA